ncbi:MAG: FG-GAP-like repeat-containing protein, partial [Chloroflexota bacterium]|nr:FG-GAP-like repeat-containing protein [Chloroflexota bacterium]
GLADLVVGMPKEDIAGREDAGGVSVIHGSPSGLSSAGDQFWDQDSTGILDQAESGDLFGASLASGDFDGDGFDDLAVAAPYEDYRDQRDGLVHIIHGSAAGLSAAGNQLWSQDSPGIRDEAHLREQFGQTLASGDFDGDGFADLAVGVWFQDFCFICNEGAVNVIYGSPGGLSPAGDQFWTQDSSGIRDQSDPFDRFGHSFAAGDFDGDGFTDLAIGAPREDLEPGDVFQDQGGVNVIHGSPAGLSSPGNQFWTQDSPGIRDVAEEGDQFGLSLAAADFDGDGWSDLVVGVRFETNAADDEGAVHVIYGSSTGVNASGNQLWSQSSPGILDDAESGDRFGWSMSSQWPASGTPWFSKASYDQEQGPP